MSTEIRRLLDEWKLIRDQEDNDDFGRERASKLDDCIQDLEALLSRSSPCPPTEEPMSPEIRRLQEFCGWLSADIPELHNVEIPRLAESLDRFLKAAAPSPADPQPPEPCVLVKGSKVVCAWGSVGCEEFHREMPAGHPSTEAADPQPLRHWRTCDDCGGVLVYDKKDVDAYLAGHQPTEEQRHARSTSLVLQDLPEGREGGTLASKSAGQLHLQDAGVGAASNARGVQLASPEAQKDEAGYQEALHRPSGDFKP